MAFQPRAPRLTNQVIMLQLSPVGLKNSTGLQSDKMAFVTASQQLHQVAILRHMLIVGQCQSVLNALLFQADRQLRFQLIFEEVCDGIITGHLIGVLFYAMPFILKQ